MRFLPTARIAKDFSFFKKVPFLANIIDAQIRVYCLYFNPHLFEMMTTLVKKIKQKPNITTNYHRLGGLEFCYNKQQIGHLHSDGLLDILLTNELSDKYLDDFMVEPHHILGISTWISIYLKPEMSIEQILNILDEAIEVSKEIQI